MNTYTRQPGSFGSSSGQRGEHCAPETPDPAKQPKKPCAEECGKLPEDCPPELPEPEPCPEPDCDCPTPPKTTSTCLDELIAKQAKEIAEGARATQFKADLEALLAKAKIATADYTHDRYKKLVTEWERLDCDIAEFIRKLVCAVPCWWCIIECFICPLIYEIRYREKMLWGEGKRYSEVHSLKDLLYWHDSNRNQKKRRLDRIKAVLSAWEKPGATIEAILASNAKLLSDSSKTLTPDAGKLVYDVFLRLVPMHLAIAPPASTGKITRIDRKYTEFCQCDKGDPDDCCGPDVGVPSLRQTLIGPQPYLIPPHEYYDIICCLATKRYEPAKDAWNAAESAYESVQGVITRYTAEIADKQKNFDKNARAALPANCCDWNEPPAAPTAPSSTAS